MPNLSVQFDGVYFTVASDDARLPMPTADDSDVEWWVAEIMLDRASAEVLEAKRSLVSIHPALGGGGNVTVERGTGGAELTIPTGLSHTRRYTAVLTNYEARFSNLTNTHQRVNVTFLILERLT